MRRADIAQRAHDRLDPAGMAPPPLGEHLADLLPLQVLLRAAQGARDDRKGFDFRKFNQILFANVRQRANHHVLAVV